jgi:hypothetical protein
MKNFLPRLKRLLLFALGFFLVPAALAVTPQAGLWLVDSEIRYEPGRGFQIDVQGGTLVLTFYGYRTDGTAQWYYASGPYAKDTFTGTLAQFEGGMAFGMPYVAAHSAGAAGNVTLTFSDSSHGQITLPGESPKSISRFVFGSSTGASSGIAPVNGMWIIDSELRYEPGRGLQIDAQGNSMVMTFYGYRSDGRAQWYYAAGTIAGNTFTARLDQFEGGMAFGMPYVAARAAGSPGFVTVTFTEGARAQITLPGESPKAMSHFAFGGSGAPAFTMAQTLTDGAQRTTLAFSGLAMMTGNLQAQTFFPPGKVADYTGFQYLRDNDPDNMGHNTSFLTRVANNVIHILDDAQLAQLKALASAQLSQIDLYGYKRYPLMKAFRRVLDGDMPAGSAGLNLNAVKKASRELYLVDGQISYDRAALYASILNSLTATQKAYLDAMKGKGWSSWPDIKDDQIRSRMQSLPQGTAVAVMTYAGDLFSWYAGSVDADVYFCPERHGTYYGGFYIKDAPAIGHEGYGIDEQLTATAGSALSDSSKGYVTAGQAATMSSLVDRQRSNLYAGTTNIVGVRTEIATLLRSLLAPATSASAVKARVLELSGIYGDLDGENNHAYATVFAQVYRTLGADQKARLAALRKSIMSGTYSDGTAFDFSVSSTYYLYSSPITDANLLAPYVANTDYLFFEP